VPRELNDATHGCAFLAVAIDGSVNDGLLLWLVQLVIFASWQVACRPQRPMIQTVEVGQIKTVR